MARSAGKARVLATFTYPTKVEVRQPEFERLGSVRHLDVNALSRAAKAEIELGYVNTCCDRQMLRAVISKGMVTGLRVDAPAQKNRSSISPEFAKMFKEARKAALKSRPAGPRFPLPLKEFLKTSVADLEIQTLVCIRICLWGSFCITCCVRTDIPDSDPICGHVTIDTTKPSLIG